VAQSATSTGLEGKDSLLVVVLTHRHEPALSRTKLPHLSHVWNRLCPSQAHQSAHRSLAVRRSPSRTRPRPKPASPLCGPIPRSRSRSTALVGPDHRPWYEVGEAPHRDPACSVLASIVRQIVRRVRVVVHLSLVRGPVRGASGRGVGFVGL
jgi:hypothetical protein